MKECRNLSIAALIWVFETCVSRIVVPRAGVEPARIAPLVFETSASTDSAIWAFCGCKDTIIL